ncbi:MAG: GNAT family protein [Gammaproteobacteria bacterium]|nr:GNAT family protein [Gammaproteobacteria bacterium]
MTTPLNQTNSLGLPIGFDVPGWSGAQRPGSQVLEGQYCRCEPLDPQAHGKDLFQAYQSDREDRVWAYLGYGPFGDFGLFQAWMASTCFTGDPFFYAIVENATGMATGVASYLNINTQEGSIEVGHINYSPLLQRTTAATEAMFLLMANAFELGNRRYEWKCNALNDKSCRLARRLGFTYEGTFRQMQVVKGKNRDTAWFSLLDREWPVIEPAFRQWLSPGNFDDQGRQRQSLSGFTSRARESL